MNEKQKLGVFGEKLAREYLMRQGYEILDANVKIGYQELDIVAERGGYLVFVEVKTRLSQAYGDGSEAMSPRKQRALRQAVSKYLTLKNWWHKEPRGDLILILVDKYRKKAKVRHFEDIL